MFYSILLIFYAFLTSYSDCQEDYIAHAALYGLFSMRLCTQSRKLMDVLDTSFNLLDCLNKRMENRPYKAACAIQSSWQ
jgi:hypothetical protein